MNDIVDVIISLVDTLNTVKILNISLLAWALMFAVVGLIIDFFVKDKKNEKES